MNGVCDCVLYVTLLDCFNLDVAYWTVSINVTLPADSWGWNALNVFNCSHVPELERKSKAKHCTPERDAQTINFWNNYKTLESAADSCRATQSAAGEYTVVISTVENRHQAWECFDSTAETQTSHTAVILLSAAGGVQKYTGIPSFRLI